MRRHVRQIERNCEPGDPMCRTRQRQALLHWAYDSRLDLAGTGDADRAALDAGGGDAASARCAAAAGIEARFVGGCVRDALLGRQSADIDLATPALPEDIIAALERAGIKAVPTGIAHGTVTAVVTSLGCRRGISRSRHCGAMSRPMAGTPASRSTPIGARTRRAAISRSTRCISTPKAPCTTRSAGWQDLAAHRVRFVGEPAQRIAEDVLRVLRYYRFEARFGHGEGDEAARAACRDAVRSCCRPCRPSGLRRKCCGCWRSPTRSRRCG